MNRNPDTSHEANERMTTELRQRDYDKIYKNISLEDIYIIINGYSYKETWAEIKGYEGLYDISNFGRVKSRKKYNVPNEIIKRQRVTQFGYMSVTLWKDKKLKHFFIHQLVCIAFLNNNKNKLFVNHINGIKTDNIILNLEWCTHSENRRHAYNTGLQNATIGISHGMAKLTEAQVLNIFNSKDSSSKLSKIYGVCSGAIGNIKTGFAWGHITGKVYLSRNDIKLTNETVLEIFNSPLRLKDLIVKYKLKRHVIMSIRSGKTYSKITGKINPYAKK